MLSSLQIYLLTRIVWDVAQASTIPYVNVLRVPFFMLIPYVNVLRVPFFMLIPYVNVLRVPFLC
ncbi:hypothetical protein BTEBP_10194 [Brochothrix thermosphacta]|nr:hypothetical protein BTEBP_10194 [Brochothrix thermosphacta]